MATTYDESTEFMTDILSNFNSISQEVNDVLIMCTWIESEDIFHLFEDNVLVYECESEDKAFERWNHLTYLAMQK